MTRADNSAFLIQANTRRHEAALAAAHHAINQLRREGKPVSYAAVAHAAGVSRAWLYRQDQIRDLISQLREHHQPPPPPHAAQPATRSASGSTPPGLRSPACGTRTAPSATRSPATSESNEHSTPKTRQSDCNDDEDTQPRQRHVYAAKTAIYQA